MLTGHPYGQLKLLQTGIQGKIFNVIRNLYSKAKSCIRHTSHNSETFDCNYELDKERTYHPYFSHLT